MKKIIFFFAMIAFAVSANANPVSLVNQLNCAVNVTMYAHNSTCTGYNCYQYSWTVSVPANTTINYNGPTDPAITWTPVPCNTNFGSFSLTDFAGSITGCGWTFDLGPCTTNLSSSGTCTGCTTSGAVHATLTPGTTIVLTLN